MRIRSKLFLAFGSLTAAIAPVIAFAQGTTINISGSIPGSNPSSSIAGTISNFYTFALLIAGVLAFGAIVFGGIKYAVGRGNPSAESEGRSWITSALIGILLLAAAYIVLVTINPNILNVNIAGLPSVSVPPPLGQTGAGGSPSGNPSAKCQAPTTGPCSLSQLQNTCFGNNAALAAGVCNVESNGNQTAKSGTDKCNDGSPVSIGLFQINVSANSIGGLNCPSAFSNAYTGSNPNCTITNQSLYNQCVNAAMNSATNIQKACQLSGNGANFNVWGPATKAACGLNG